MKEIVCKDGRKFRRVSRWITLQTKYNPTKLDSLWDYASDENGYHPYNDKFNPKSELVLYFFRHKGRKYALDQFYVLGSFFVSEPSAFYDDEDGKLRVIGTVDIDGNMFHPFYGEWDEYCERVRLYERIE